MKQNDVTLNLTETRLAAVDAALAELETQLAGLVALAPGMKRRMPSLGERSEALCRQALQMLSANPQLVPPNVDVGDALRDLQTRDLLRPRALRLSQLMSRLEDTDYTLGSDAMSVATQGYGLLKLVGKTEGLDEVRKDLGARFAKRRRPAVAEQSAA